MILSFFILINLAFAAVYYLIGIENLGGVHAGSPFKNFTEAFFFSTQTFTTVGYGRIAPSGFMASSVASIEALVGLLSFAVVTGLFYGRFSRPRVITCWRLPLAATRSKCGSKQTVQLICC